MKPACLLLAFTLCASTAIAQQLPDAPSSKLDLTLFAARAAARSLDVTSTNHVLGLRGGYECELPPWIVNRTASLVAFEASVVGAERLGERILRRHGHPRLARLVPALDAAAVSVTVARNYLLRPSFAPLARVQGTAVWTPIRRKP